MKKPAAVTAAAETAAAVTTAAETASAETTAAVRPGAQDPEALDFNAVSTLGHQPTFGARDPSPIRVVCEQPMIDR